MADKPFQTKIKTITKLIENGVKTEKELLALNFDSALQIEGITMQDIGVISQLQKHTKDLYTYLSGGGENNDGAK